MLREKMFIFCVALFFMCSCNDEGVIVIDDYIVKDTTQYTLEQTEWKLVLFVDAENNTSREPITEPYYHQDMYAISFKSYDDNDTTYILGIAHLNAFWGTSIVNYANFTIKVHSLMTEGAYPNFDNDENNYRYGIRNSTEFEITATQLKLFYNGRKNYLLFKRLK